MVLWFCFLKNEKCGKGTKGKAKPNKIEILIYCMLYVVHTYMYVIFTT